MKITKENIRHAMEQCVLARASGRSAVHDTQLWRQLGMPADGEAFEAALKEAVRSGLIRRDGPWLTLS